MAKSRENKRGLRPGKLKSLGMFLGVSVLAGALLAGLAVPFAALAGVSATLVSESVDALPAYLDTPPEAMRTNIYLADGSYLATLYDENREVLETLDDISPLMRWAQVDIEDERFYEHGPMDLQGTLRALITNILGGNTQGGSSITQQYVKLVRIEQAMANEDPEEVAAVQAPTLQRKIEEMRYAIAIERRFTKDEILLRYLNIAYYGDQAYGVEAAALHYFNVHAADLNLAQAAMLAGIVQNPTYNPVAYPEEAEAKRDLVLDAMLRLGHVEQGIEDGLIIVPGCEDQETPEGIAACTAATAGFSTRQLAEKAVAAAKETHFDPAGMGTSTGGCVGTRYPIVCSYIEAMLYKDTFFGDTAEARERNVKRGGYEVYTTIHPDWQDQAQAAVSEWAAPTDPVIVTVNEVRPGTGEIWAMAQNRYALGTNVDAGETFWNYSVGLDAGGYIGFQAGSTFKLFTVAAALEQGFPPSYKINSPATITLSNKSMTDCDGNVNSIPIVGGWRVQGGRGTINMYEAAAFSVNTYFAQLVIRVGACAAARMAAAAGVKLGNGTDIVYGASSAQLAEMQAAGEDTTGYTGYWDKPSFTLGVAEVTPLSLAAAYGTFGARGKACTPSIISRIENRDGMVVKDYNLGVDNCVENAIDPEVADGVNAVFKYVTTNGVVGGIGFGDRDQASKTGTTETADQIWIMSYTPEISVSVMVAVDKDPRWDWFWDPRGDNLVGVTLPSGRYMNGTSISDPPTIFKWAVWPMIYQLPATPFVAPSAQILRGTPITVPSLSGTEAEVKQRLEDAGFSITRDETYSDLPEGDYVSTTCEPYRGGLCTMYYSKGERPS
jgi:membrane peptidoglycan carboxypeptidase